MQRSTRDLDHAKLSILNWLLFANFILGVVEVFLNKLIDFWHGIHRLF